MDLRSSSTRSRTTVRTDSCRGCEGLDVTSLSHFSTGRAPTGRVWPVNVRGGGNLTSGSVPAKDWWVPLTPPLFRNGTDSGLSQKRGTYVNKTPGVRRRVNKLPRSCLVDSYDLSNSWKDLPWATHRDQSNRHCKWDSTVLVICVVNPTHKNSCTHVV